MNPYSHLILASRLEGFVRPADPDEYYWGSIAADIRYLAGLRRGQTHLQIGKILEAFPAYPGFRPFLQGYLVHLLCDEIDLGSVFCRHFPFSLLKKRFSHRHYAVMLELYCFKNERFNREIAGTHNRFLEEMGITQSQAEKFVMSLNHYRAGSASDARLQELFILMGLQDDPRIEQYLHAARGIQRKRLLKGMIFLGIRAGKIIDELTGNVKENPCWQSL